MTIHIVRKRNFLENIAGIFSLKTSNGFLNYSFLISTVFEILRVVFFQIVVPKKKL